MQKSGPPETLDAKQEHSKDCEEEASSPTTNKAKTRSRLRSALRSFRGAKKKSEEVLSSGGEDGEDGEPLSPADSDAQALSPTSAKKKTKLSKKFSLSGIRKYKVSPKKSEQEFTSTSTQTGRTLERNSRLLVELGSDHDQYSEGSPVKYDKVRKLQITIQGKKIESNRRSLPTTTTEITGATAIANTSNDEDYLTADLPPSPPTPSKSPSPTGKKSSKKKSKGKKHTAKAVIPTSEPPRQVTVVTENPGDIPPQTQAPAKPERTLLRPLGTIKKSSSSPDQPPPTHHSRLLRQRSREDSIEPELMLRERSTERGRRFPRPSLSGSVEDNKEASASASASASPLHAAQLYRQSTSSDSQLNHFAQSIDDSPLSGNNLRNPNLSGAITDKANTDTEGSPPTVREKQIQFAVGTHVRPPKVAFQQTGDSQDFSSLDSSKSFDSAGADVSEGSVARRKIRYIEQATFYTDEEREIIAGKRPVLGDLRGISEYSLESDSSMPAFGDLTMDQEEPPPIMTSSTEKREHLYKILVIGELGTGKTSFIKRYVHQFFSQNYRATIGVDFALKVLHWDQNTIVRLQLWDIAGQERFGNMTRVYYKEAVGAFIVFDVTRSGTFDCVTKWKEDLDSKVQLPDGSPIPCILLANKCDQEKQGAITSPEKIDEYVKENGFAGWFETSAKENINIDESARALVNKILLNDKLITAADIADSEKFNLGGGSGAPSKTQSLKSKCSC